MEFLFAVITSVIIINFVSLLLYDKDNDGTLGVFNHFTHLFKKLTLHAFPIKPSFVPNTCNSLLIIDTGTRLRGPIYQLPNYEKETHLWYVPSQI